MISEDRKTAAGLEVVIVDLGEHGLPYHYVTFRDPCRWHTALAYPVLAAWLRRKPLFDSAPTWMERPPCPCHPDRGKLAST